MRIKKLLLAFTLTLICIVGLSVGQTKMKQNSCTNQEVRTATTGFNPNYANKGIKKEQLRVEFTVKFVTKGYSSSFDKKLENAFKSRWVDFEQKWSFNSQNSTFSYAF